jgi:hypothetical protein
MSTRVVRFLRAKRYPHPAGRRRAVGTIMPIDAATAKQWVRVGLVEFVSQSHRGESAAGGEPRQLEDLTVAELRALAAERGVDLGAARLKAELIAALASDPTT